eukprot:3201887-Amphidinium_carterae.1
MTAALGSRPAVDQLACLRRVWHEAYIAVAANERTKTDRTADSGPKRIPVQERAAMQDAQRQRLVGLNIDGPLEPSHVLVDLAHQMIDDDL